MTPEDRAWEVVRRAFEERPPAQARVRTGVRLAGAAAAVLAAAALLAAFSPPGHAVFEQMRKAVGVEHAAPALVSLPAPGRLLVTSAQGETWLVTSDGLRRSLGDYRDAEWSPHGLYVVATKANALVALDPNGNLRWTLARLAPRDPRWEGTFTDTRIAYLAAGGLRVVAGDGTGDRLLDANASSVPPAWQPGGLHTVAYASGDGVVLRRADGKLVWRTQLPTAPTSLAWSTDGAYLAAFERDRAAILDRRGRVVHSVSLLGARLMTGAFRPGTHDLAVIDRKGGQTAIELVDVDRPGHAKLLFTGPGALGDFAWSPDGRWLLVAWPAANQWVFIHGATVRAVGNIRAQFDGADRIRWGR